MSDPPLPPDEAGLGGPAPGGPGLRGALVRFALFTLIVGVLAALLLFTPARQYLDKEALTALLAELRQAWWAPLALIAGLLLIAPSGIPVTPLIAAGGIVFGPLWGWLYNLLGSLLGAVLSFGLAHALGKDLVEHLAGERRMRKVEAMLEQHGFWTLVGVRFLPVPFALINYGLALTGLRFGRFITTTTLGLLPAVLMWTYLYHALVGAATADERGDLVRNVLLIVALVGATLLLRPLGRLLLKRDQDPKAP